jgi:hypothetical protein
VGGSFSGNVYIELLPSLAPTVKNRRCHPPICLRASMSDMAMLLQFRLESQRKLVTLLVF